LWAKFDRADIVYSTPNYPYQRPSKAAGPTCLLPGQKARGCDPGLPELSSLNAFIEEQHVVVAAIGAGHHTQIAQQILESVVPKEKISAYVPGFAAAAHDQIPRLDGDQAERCDGNLPFASSLMAVLSMTGHWAGQFCRRRNSLFGGSSNGRF